MNFLKLFRAVAFFFFKLAHNVLQLMAGGFYKRLECSRLTLGAVSGVGRNLSVGSLYLI